jgi:hypothetical protein
MIDARSTAEFFRSARRADVLALSEECFFLSALQLAHHSSQMALLYR